MPANSATTDTSIYKIKRLLELILYYPLDSIALFGHHKRQKNDLVAIIHFQQLGDYFIWLPYGQALAKHFQSQKTKAVLIINEQVAPLAKIHFHDIETVEISRTSFMNDLTYRFRLLQYFAKLAPSRTIYDTCPRDAWIGDSIVRALGAPAIGFASTNQGRTSIDNYLFQRLYAHLLPETTNTHQSLQHLRISKLVGSSNNIAPLPKQPLQDQRSPMPDSYMVIAPSASRSYRRWPVERFIALTKKVLQAQTEWRVVVLGSQDDTELGEQIISALGREQATNMAGRTDLNALVNWIQHAQLLIGNDSGAGHIAAACGTPSLIVVGGGHYGRCFPYAPDEAPIRKLPSTITHHMDCFGCNWKCRYLIAPGKPAPCIEGITIDVAWNEMKKLLYKEGRDRN